MNKKPWRVVGHRCKQRENNQRPGTVKGRLSLASRAQVTLGVLSVWLECTWEIFEKLIGSAALDHLGVFLLFNNQLFYFFWNCL